MDWGLSEYAEWAFWYIDDILIMAETLSALRAREGTIRTRLREIKVRLPECL